MFTKTSIALAIIVALASGAVAAEKRQHGVANAQAATPVFVNRCAHGVWDAYAVRCDSGGDN
jgi:hypothetical protein